MNEFKEQDVYEEYRQRLIDNKVSILNLEIFETFMGRDFVFNSYDLLEVLIENDTKQIIEEIEEIKENIIGANGSRYDFIDRVGYHLIAEGYILRLKAKLARKRENNE